MELVMLGKIDKTGFLRRVEREKRQGQEEENSCNVVIYDPRPQEVVDSVISEKLATLKKEKTQKIEGEAIEREKLMNAVTFTDVPATIKKAGFHRDGSPKVAIAGLFDRDAGFIVRDGWAKYCSTNLSVAFAELKNDWKNLIVFFVGLACVVASVSISISVSFEDLDFYSITVLRIFGIFIPLVTLILVLVAVSSALEDGSYFTCIMLPGIGKVRTRSSFYINVPPATESVLAKISGHGPFAILFEVTEGWRKVEPDPVILRVINIDGQQFFEPVVGYDMTPLEKSSLTTA